MATRRTVDPCRPVAAVGIQSSVASVLVELTTSVPGLPEAHWTIPQGQTEGYRALHGHLQGASETLEAFRAYAAVLSDHTITSTPPYEQYGRKVRGHWVKALWRGVAVEVLVVLPAAVDVQDES